MAGQSYYEVIREAVADMAAHGFTSAERVAYWEARIAEAAEGAMRSTEQMEADLREALASTYRRLVEREGVMKLHPGVTRFALDRVRPQLRAELDRRILAAANLIKLRRTQAKAQTLARFSGWATSLPPGKAKKTADAGEAQKSIGKALKSLPFEVRRVNIDQGHKLTASINEVIAVGGGALGLTWHSHFRQAGYNYRPDHKERDGRFYLLKGSWATERGLVKPGPDGWYKDITAVAQEPFCRCWAEWIYNLRDVPAECVTAKGKAELDRVRQLVEAL